MDVTARQIREYTALTIERAEAGARLEAAADALTAAAVARNARVPGHFDMMRVAMVEHRTATARVRELWPEVSDDWWYAIGALDTEHQASSAISQASSAPNSDST